jgi:hypothetical protein
MFPCQTSGPVFTGAVSVWRQFDADSFVTILDNLVV